MYIYIEGDGGDRQIEGRIYKYISDVMSAISVSARVGVDWSCCLRCVENDMSSCLFIYLFFGNYDVIYKHTMTERY